MMKDRKKKKKIHDRIRGKFSQASNKRRTKFFGDHLAFKSRLFLHGNFNTQHVILCAVVDTENDPRSTVIWIGRKKKKTNFDSHLLPVYHCHAYQQMPQIWLKFYIWSTDNIARKKVENFSSFTVRAVQIEAYLLRFGNCFLHCSNTNCSIENPWPHFSRKRNCVSQRTVWKLNGAPFCTCSVLPDPSCSRLNFFYSWILCGEKSVKSDKINVRSHSSHLKTAADMAPIHVVATLVVVFTLHTFCWICNRLVQVDGDQHINSPIAPSALYCHAARSRGRLVPARRCTCRKICVSHRSQLTSIEFDMFY